MKSFGLWCLGTAPAIIVAGLCAASFEQAIEAQVPPAARSAGPARTVWSGVYSSEQAARGKRDFELYCTSCHGAELGGGDGPPLVGGDFMRNWFEDDLRSLVDKVHSRMPADAPGSLTPAEATDLVSFLLEANGFPAGAEPLSTDPATQTAIRIQGKDGPAPVPNFSLVVVIGCLTQGADSQWVLARGTEPVRSRESASSARTPDTPVPAPGTQTFRLLDAASARPQNYKDQAVEVKGLLMRQPAGAALNVTAIQPVAPKCP
jgi:mono/diheme cytochrome c family protein